MGTWDLPTLEVLSSVLTSGQVLGSIVYVALSPLFSHEKLHALSHPFMPAFVIDSDRI